MSKPDFTYTGVHHIGKVVECRPASADYEFGKHIVKVRFTSGPIGGDLFDFRNNPLAVGHCVRLSEIVLTETGESGMFLDYDANDGDK